MVVNGSGAAGIAITKLLLKMGTKNAILCDTKGAIYKGRPAGMNKYKDAIIMAMANPNPEILPNLAVEAGARVVCTGRSDFLNQVNNVLAFPGIFRGALDVRASEINDEMKIAAAYAIAELVSEEELKEDFVIPNAFDLRIAPKVASYVAKAAIETGVARKTDVTPEMVEKHTKELLGV